MKRTIAIYGLAALLLSAVSCKKGTNVTSLGGYPLKSLAPAIKTVQIDAAKGGSFYGNSGTRYVFQPNSFADKSGRMVSGKVTIEATEFLTRVDMICAEVLPVSNGQPLISGGEVYVRAVQNNTELQLQPGITFTVNMPTNTGPASSGMSLFSGTSIVVSNNTIPGLQTPVYWRPVDSPMRSSIVYNGDTISMFPDWLGLANADKFLSDPNYQTVSIRTEGTGSNRASWVYAVFKDMNGAFPLWNPYTPGSNGTARLPQAELYLVAMSVIDNELYAGISSSFTPEENGTYTVILTKTAPKAFKEKLAAL